MFAVCPRKRSSWRLTIFVLTILLGSYTFAQTLEFGEDISPAAQEAFRAALRQMSESNKELLEQGMPSSYLCGLCVIHVEREGLVGYSVEVAFNLNLMDWQQANGSLPERTSSIAIGFFQFPAMFVDALTGWASIYAHSELNDTILGERLDEARRYLFVTRSPELMSLELGVGIRLDGSNRYGIPSGNVQLSILSANGGFYAVGEVSDDGRYILLHEDGEPIFPYSKEPDVGNRGIKTFFGLE